MTSALSSVVAIYTLYSFISAESETLIFAPAEIFARKAESSSAPCFTGFGASALDAQRVLVDFEDFVI